MLTLNICSVSILGIIVLLIWRKKLSPNILIISCLGLFLFAVVSSLIIETSTTISPTKGKILDLTKKQEEIVSMQEKLENQMLLISEAKVKYNTNIADLVSEINQAKKKYNIKSYKEAPERMVYNLRLIQEIDAYNTKLSDLYKATKSGLEESIYMERRLSTKSIMLGVVGSSKVLGKDIDSLLEKYIPYTEDFVIKSEGLKKKSLEDIWKEIEKAPKTAFVDDSFKPLPARKVLKPLPTRKEAKKTPIRKASKLASTDKVSNPVSTRKESKELPIRKASKLSFADKLLKQVSTRKEAKELPTNKVLKSVSTVVVLKSPPIIRPQKQRFTFHLSEQSPRNMVPVVHNQSKSIFSSEKVSIIPEVPKNIPTEELLKDFERKLTETRRKEFKVQLGKADIKQLEDWNEILKERKKTLLDKFNDTNDVEIRSLYFEVSALSSKFSRTIKQVKRTKALSKVDKKSLKRFFKYYENLFTVIKSMESRAQLGKGNIKQLEGWVKILEEREALILNEMNYIDDDEVTNFYFQLSNLRFDFLKVINRIKRGF